MEAAAGTVLAAGIENEIRATIAGFRANHEALEDFLLHFPPCAEAPEVLAGRTAACASPSPLELPSRKLPSGLVLAADDCLIFDPRTGMLFHDAGTSQPKASCILIGVSEALADDIPPL